MTSRPLVQFPAVAPGEDVVLSATTFVSYERCPEQAAGRLRGVYGPESRVAFVGGLAHRIFSRHLASGPIAPDELAAACKEEIGSAMNPKLASLGLKPSQLGVVIEEVGALYDRFKQLGADGFVGSEVGIEVEPAPGVRLKGSIDAVFSDETVGTRLVDWKTASLGEPDAQLAFYALLWALDRGEIPGRVEAVSIGTGERTEETPSTAGVQLTATRVAKVVTELRTTWRLGGEFPRVAGPWCRWCPLLDGCAEGQAAQALLDN